MRILHLVNYFQPELGYQEYYLAHKQQELGHDVLVVTSDRRSPSSRRPQCVGIGRGTEEGVQVERLPSLLCYKVFCLPRGVAKALRRIKPDVIHCHGMHYSYFAVIAARLKRELGYRLIYDTHAADFNTNLENTPFKKVLNRVYRRTLLRMMIQAADAVVAIGPEEQEFICREAGLHKTQVPIIPLGVDIQTFRFNQSGREQVRRSMGLSAEDVVLLHVGQVIPRKDTITLIRAIGPLTYQMPNLYVLIVGGGEKVYVETIKRAAQAETRSGSVLWTGPVHRSELPGFISAADIGVWPGDQAITIQEAMAVGLPLILSRGPGNYMTTEWLLSRSNGVSFERGNAEALAECIRALVFDPAKRRDMGLKSRRFAEEVFDWQKIALQFLEVYQKSCVNPYALNQPGRKTTSEGGTT